MSKNGNLFKQASMQNNLARAWNVVRSSGNASKSEEIREETSVFNEDALSNIRKIQKEIRKKDFQFKSKGILSGKKKKKKRPIVIGSVSTRIVQRSILDVLQKQKAIKKYLEAPGSFGGIKKRNKDHEIAVSGAINALIKEMRNGAVYYIKSDIQSFFTKVPFSEIAASLKKGFNDKEFLRLISEATVEEVENLNELNAHYQEKFDFKEHGVPQGCCLSPLYANMFLYEFDLLMHKTAEISCLRYLDDFIIVGNSKHNVRNAFAEAQEWLDKNNLTVYLPDGSNSKATEGQIREGVDFLGVHISGHGSEIHTSPSGEKKAEFKEKIRVFLAQNQTAQRKNNFMTNALYNLNKYLKSWGDQYCYCNNDDVFDSLDVYTTKLLREYFFELFKNFDKQPDMVKDAQFRELCGVRFLRDRKKYRIKKGKRDGDKKTIL